jgi:hypothetical protein
MNTKMIWQTKLTEAYDEDLEGVGSVRWEGDACYRWVKNEDASNALSYGQAAYHALANTTNFLKYVKQAATANLSALGGIVMATAGLAANTGTNPKIYGWIQVFGYAASVSVSGQTTGGSDLAVGDFLKGVNSANHFVLDATTGTAPTYSRTVRLLEAVGTTTTPAAAYKKALIQCLQ